MNIKAFFQKYWVIFILGFILIASFLLRLWHLGRIGDQIFDEVYFIKFAENYRDGISFFDIHPPLGKLIIASGLKLFGDTSFTWRIMPAIFGTLLILIGYFTGKELSNKKTGLLAAIIFALDGLLLVYSRTGLIDIFLSFFILLTFYFFLKFANSKKISWLILTGVALGLGASIKYIGASVALLIAVVMMARKISLRDNRWQFLSFLVILPLAIYSSFFFFNFRDTDFFSRVLEWHSQSIGYNIGLTEGHPYGSKWWSWFLLLRPIWLYYKDLDGKIVGVLGMGNPLLWWSALAIIPLLIWGTFKKYENHLIVLAGFLIFLFIWAPFRRVLFYYHAMPSFLFLALGTALWLERLVRIPYGKYYLVIFLIAAMALFIFFAPLWLGMPIISDQFYHRIWLKGWI